MTGLGEWTISLFFGAWPKLDGDLSGEAREGLPTCRPGARGCGGVSVEPSVVRGYASFWICALPAAHEQSELARCSCVKLSTHCRRYSGASEGPHMAKLSALCSQGGLACPPRMQALFRLVPEKLMRAFTQSPRVG